MAADLNSRIIQAKTKEISRGTLMRRRGKPRTNEERRRRHKALYGTDKLPPRGTGLRRRNAV